MSQPLDFLPEVQIQSRPVHSGNGNGRTAFAAAASAKRVAPDGNVTVMARSPGAKRIEIRHNGRVLGTIDGRATIDAAKLGGGFNFLRVVGVDGDRQ